MAAAPTAEPIAEASEAAEEETASRGIVLVPMNRRARKADSEGNLLRSNAVYTYRVTDDREIHLRVRTTKQTIMLLIEEDADGPAVVELVSHEWEQLASYFKQFDSRNRSVNVIWDGRLLGTSQE